MHSSVLRQSHRPEFLTSLGLPYTFLVWQQLVNIHVWLLHVRLHMETDDKRKMNLLDVSGTYWVEKWLFAGVVCVWWS